MNHFLQKIEGAEQSRLARRTSVIGEAESLRREFARRVTRVQPASIVSLAMSRHPGCSAEQAFESLRRAVAELLQALETCSDESETAFKAEKERLAPLVAAATHRHMVIEEHISRTNARISANERNRADKRERLRKAGLTDAQIDGVVAPEDSSNELAERAALKAENEALQEFLRTRDEQDLPEGFAAEAREAA